MIYIDLKFMVNRVFSWYLNRKGAISCAFRDPAGIRTQDHYIKSVMLYQLSYGIYFELNYLVSFKVVQI